MKYDNKNRPKRDFKNTEVPFDIMLRQFKKYCERKGIVEEVRELMKKEFGGKYV